MQDLKITQLSKGSGGRRNSFELVRREVARYNEAQMCVEYFLLDASACQSDTESSRLSLDVS